MSAQRIAHERERLQSTLARCVQLLSTAPTLPDAIGELVGIQLVCEAGLARLLELGARPQPAINPLYARKSA